MSTRATPPVQTPIFDSVLMDLKWHPDMLREPFDVDAAIALSYDRHLPALTSTGG